MIFSKSDKLVFLAAAMAVKRRQGLRLKLGMIERNFNSCIPASSPIPGKVPLNFVVTLGMRYPDTENDGTEDGAEDGARADAAAEVDATAGVGATTGAEVDETVGLGMLEDEVVAATVLLTLEPD